MKDKIVGYDDSLSITTEVVNPSSGSMYIIKATVEKDFLNDKKIVTAHASGFIRDNHGINVIEEEAINRAISLI